MKPAAFAYSRPESVAEAAQLLHEMGSDAALLAGGQSLVPLLNARALRPTHLIDINGLSSIDAVRLEGDGARIGALSRHAVIERTSELSGAWGVLGEAARHIGSPPIRARGTFGGSISNADPAAELPLVALTLDAVIVVESTQGSRSIPATSFFQGLRKTALASDEILVEVRVPAPPEGAGTAFEEFSRRTGGVAVVSACTAVAIEDGRCTWARVGLGAIAPTPVRSANAEGMLVGASPSQEAIEEAAAAAAAEFDPAADFHASSAFRRRLIDVLVRRALGRSFAAASAMGARGAGAVDGANGSSWDT